MPSSPIEFVRRLLNGKLQNAGNRVQLEDNTGVAYSDAHPLKVLATVNVGAITVNALTDTQLRASPVPMSGPVTNTELRASPVPVTGGLTNTQLRAAPVPVSGPLTNTELRLTDLPVSGPLTNTQLRLTAVPVSGPLTDTQLRLTAVPVSGPLTDTQLRLTAVPVSGPATDSQLRLTPLPIYLADEVGVAYGVKHVQNKPRVSSMPYTYDIAEGNIPGHAVWHKIGYNGGVTAATEADVWSGTGPINFPTAPTQVDVVSSSAGDEDMGTPIFSGTSSGGTATSLKDATKNFNGGTAVQVGDCVILDKSGAVPEWGYVTAIFSNTELTVGGGFSAGGTGFGLAGRAYTVLDKNTAGKTGAHAVKLSYLTSLFAQKYEILVLDGNAPVLSVNTDIYRVQSLRVIATGSANKTIGSISLRKSTGSPVYTFISIGYTRARNIAYTVPFGKTLYISSGTFGYASSHTQPHYGRLYLRSNAEPDSLLRTGDIFYPYIEVLACAGTIVRDFELPIKFISGDDIKVSIVADYAGIATATLFGWLE